MGAKNKENLQKLLEFLRHSVLNESSNKWFVEELRTIIAPNLNAKVDDIYEYCIEEIIKQQAQEFYKDFVIHDLQETLIQDFIRMEHWRRRNNLDEFGMAVFQQIEGIINYLGNNKVLNDIYVLTKNALCYVDYSNPIVTNRYSKSTYSIGQFIFYDPKKYSELGHKSLSLLPTYYKFKVIDYYICHQASLQMSQYNQFSEEMNLLSMIYALRNKNHRGNEATMEELAKLKPLEDNPSRAFLTLTTFLTWFIDSVQQGYPISKELIEFSKQNFPEPKALAPSLRFTGEKLSIDQLERGRRRR